MAVNLFQRTPIFCVFPRNNFFIFVSNLKIIIQKIKIHRMTLIKSISGIRGTIGGKVGDNLTPVDAVKFASAYGTWLKNIIGIKRKFNGCCRT